MDILQQRFIQTLIEKSEKEKKKSLEEFFKLFHRITYFFGG
jgi:hypothetical protein